VSARLAQVHYGAKQYAKDHNSEFATGIKFTGRSLVFSSNIVGSQKNSQDHEIGAAVCQAMGFTYCNPNKRSAEFYRKVFEFFAHEPALQISQLIERRIAHIDEDYRCVLQPLRKLQVLWHKSGFDLLHFSRCVGVFRLGNTPQLHFHLCDTISMIEERKDPHLSQQYDDLRLLKTVIFGFVSILTPNKKVKQCYLDMEIRDPKLRIPEIDTARANYFIFLKLSEAGLLTFHVPQLFTCGPFFQKAKDLREKKSFESLIDFISHGLTEKPLLDEIAHFLDGAFLTECGMCAVRPWLPLLFGLAHSNVALSLNSTVITAEQDDVESLISLHLTEDYLLSDESKVIVKGTRLELPVSRRDCIKELERMFRDVGILSAEIPQFSSSGKSSFCNFDIAQFSHESK
jgi:hypothetical protein